MVLSEFPLNSKRNSSFFSLSPSQLKRPRRDAQPACSLKIAALYQPGAILDSQTSDSQWADNLGESQSQDYDIQEHQVQIKEEDESLALADTEEPRALSPPTSPHLSVEHTHMEEIKSHIKKIADMRSREFRDERDALMVVLNVMTEELESVNQENVSVAARRDILLEELDLERRWIRELEYMLKDNNITLPNYPKRK